MVYRVRYSENGREIEVEGDKKYINTMLGQFGFLADAKKDTPKDLNKAKENSTRSLKNISPAEFILEKQFKKHTDIVLAFGYYLEKHKGMAKFSPSDINNCYYEAKLESSNTSQMIVQNLKRGYMMSAKIRGEAGKAYYVLTQTGLSYIDKFSKNKA